MFSAYTQEVNLKVI